MICKTCNSEISDSAVFCSNCGTPVDDFDSTSLLNENDDVEESTGLLVEEEPKVEKERPIDYGTAYSAPPENTPQDSSVNSAFVNPGFQPDFSVDNTPPMQNQYDIIENPPSNVPDHNEFSNPPIGGNMPIEQEPNMKDCFVKYWQSTAHFEGRSRRSDFWYPVLMNMLITLVGTLTVIGYPIVFIYSFTTIAPALSVLIRRLHDVGKEWYNLFFMLIPIAGPIIILVFVCKDSQPESNKFGPNPKTNYNN